MQAGLRLGADGEPACSLSLVACPTDFGGAERQHFACGPLAQVSRRPRASVCLAEAPLIGLVCSSQIKTHSTSWQTGCLVASWQPFCDEWMFLGPVHHPTFLQPPEPGTRGWGSLFFDSSQFHPVKGVGTTPHPMSSMLLSESTAAANIEPYRCRLARCCL